MIDFPNAKINIGLQITEKRSDGFHNLSTIFYPVTWQDILEIILSEKTSFESSGIDIPDDGKENLCLQAYQLLKKDFDLSPVKIHLHKVIPTGAGLGGGSSDAAFTLKILNKLFQLDLSNEKLKDYASQLGSDCAFFIENKSVWGVKKGDILKDIYFSLKGKYILLIYPKLNISTAEAYSGVIPQIPKNQIPEIIQKPISEWKNYLFNDFEQSIFPKYPILQNIKEKLYEIGAVYASMSGSGSTIYGIFPDKVQNPFKNEYLSWEGFL